MSVFGPWLPMPEQQQLPPGSPAGRGAGSHGSRGQNDGAPEGRDRQDRARETREDETGSIYGGPSPESAPSPSPTEIEFDAPVLDDDRIYDDDMKNVRDYVESELTKQGKQAEEAAALAKAAFGLGFPGLGSLMGTFIADHIKSKQEAFAKGVRDKAQNDLMGAAVDASLGQPATKGGPGNQGEGPPDDIISKQEPPENEPDPEDVLPEGVDPDDDAPGLDELIDPFEGDALRWAQSVRNDIKRAGARLAQI